MIIKTADAIARGGVGVKLSTGQEAFRRKTPTPPRASRTKKHDSRVLHLPESVWVVLSIFLNRVLPFSSLVFNFFLLRLLFECHALNGRRKKVEPTGSFSFYSNVLRSVYKAIAEDWILG